MVKSCNGGLTVHSTDSTAIMTSTHFTPQDASELARAMRAARNYQGGVLLTEKGGVTERSPAQSLRDARLKGACFLRVDERAVSDAAFLLLLSNTW